MVLAAAIDAIADLGKAIPGDKTMLDALLPAMEVLRSAPADEAPAHACARAAAAAGAGADATIPLVARKGRASYLGERSAGHRDPGAASSVLLLRCLASAYAQMPPDTRPTRAVGTPAACLRPRPAHGERKRRRRAARRHPMTDTERTGDWKGKEWAGDEPTRASR